MSAPPPDESPLTPPEVMRRLVSGYFVSQAIYVVAKLDLAEHIANGARTAEALAEVAGLHAPSIRRVLVALTQMLCAVDASMSKGRQIVIAGTPGAEDTKALIREARSQFAPNQIVILADGGAGQAWIGKRNASIADMKPKDGKAAAYVCEDFVCKAPETDPAKLREMLKK